MSKQIYSLVLSEQVIDKIDREALIRGSNRSQIINDILCRAFDISTPDIKMNQVMDLMTASFKEVSSLQMLSASHGNTLQLRTSVSYKYNPKLKFVIEMSGKSGPIFAKLRVYSRTTSDAFLQSLVMYFGYLTEFEENLRTNIGLREVNGSGYVYEDNKFVKRFECDWTTADVKADAIAAYLFSYIQFLDDSIKMFFDHFGDWKFIDQQMLALYRKHL